MMKFTRLNDTRFYVNPDQLLTVESTPDSVITLANGEKHMVRESVSNIVEQFQEYKKSLYQNGPTINR
ncbi:MAG: flagellar FlbD family protein [Cyanobacteria bacterium]|nr:flagellar FlbD family protein [Cyanobacteriota bacterium]